MAVLSAWGYDEKESQPVTVVKPSPIYMYWNLYASQDTCGMLGHLKGFSQRGVYSFLALKSKIHLWKSLYFGIQTGNAVRNKVLHLIYDLKARISWISLWAFAKKPKKQTQKGSDIWLISFVLAFKRNYSCTTSVGSIIFLD